MHTEQEQPLQTLPPDIVTDIIKFTHKFETDGHSFELPHTVYEEYLRANVEIPQQEYLIITATVLA